MQKETKIGFIKILIFVIILEVFVFNYKSYRILSSENQTEYTKENFSYYEEESDYVYLEIEISTEVKTFNIVLNGFEETVEYQVFYTDETSSEYRTLPSKTYIESNESSKYIATYLSGESEKIAVKVYSSNTEIEKIIINKKIPFKINIWRFIFVYLICAFIYSIRKFEIFKIPFSNFNQELILLGISFFFIILVFYINIYSSTDTADYYCYDFVNALVNGNVYLEETPSEELLNLENPYDYLQRTKEGLVRDEDYIWDAALYNEKYYVYFGILPALILFLPFYIITGKYLLTNFAILFFSILTVIALKELLCNIFKKYFKEIPFKILVFSLLILLFGSQILILNGAPRFYELAVISGLFFAITGINNIFEATKHNKINYKYIFLASLFLSLSVACRPTMLFVSLVALPVFIKIIKKNIKEKDKKNIVKSICTICFPYMVVGISLMIYNYIRFDSIFEFGSSYQLTLNDMSSLKNRFATLGVGLLSNLFNIPNLSLSFPFITNNESIINFYGYYYIESMLGGLFMLVPICFSIFLIYKLYKKSENRETIKTIILFIIVGMIICIVSTMLGGSLQRYLADYAWILIIAGIMTFVELYNIYNTDEARHIITKILGILVLYIIIINFSAGVVSEESCFKCNSTNIYYSLQYTINFWE